MNIIGHFSIGLIGSVITMNPLFLVGSLIPDVSLIGWRPGNKLSKWRDITYGILHSLFFVISLLYFFPILGMGIFLHQLCDWWVHYGEFKTKIFYPFNYQPFGYDINDKKAFLISGGYDSSAILELVNRDDYDYFFFDYNQSYNEEEIVAINHLKLYYGIKINTIKEKWGTDIKNRNYLMISKLNSMGYDTIVSGSRNILPIFDKYKDSNYFNLKIFQYIMKIRIELPICLWSKKKIINKIPKDLLSKLYTTEK